MKQQILNKLAKRSAATAKILVACALTIGTVATAAFADIYEVPVPAGDAERLAPYAKVPMSANFRLRFDHDKAILNYDLPAVLTGSEPHSLKLEANLNGRTQFNPGDELKLNGGYENTPPGFTNPIVNAHADCIFGENQTVACTVSYDEVTINQAEQTAWLTEEGYSPEQISGFREVAGILGHEAIGIVHTKVRIRPANGPDAQ